MRIGIKGTIKVIYSMLKALPVTMSLSILVLTISLMIAVVMALCEYFNVKRH